MKLNLLILGSMFIIAVAGTEACTRRFGDCKNSIECCSHYCRDGVCLRFGDSQEDEGIRNPCQPSPCRVGEACVIVVVPCWTYPCPAVARCYY